MSEQLRIGLVGAGPWGHLFTGGQWFAGSRLLSTKSATTGANGVAALKSGNVKVAAGTVMKFCVTGVALSGAVWDTALFAPTTASDCATWTVP